MNEEVKKYVENEINNLLNNELPIVARGSSRTNLKMFKAFRYMLLLEYKEYLDTTEDDITVEDALKYIKNMDDTILSELRES